MPPPVVVDQLRKTYGETVALDGISFSVERGEVFALLGPNGAGKTTSVEILEGYRVPTSGDVRVLGHEPASATSALRDRIGIMLQEGGLEPQLQVEEAIALYRSPYSRPRGVDELLELVGLSEHRKAALRTLSGGSKRRLDLALALVGDPDVVFLDEPTTGFDPAARRRAWELIEQLRGFGKTILLTTHYLEEAQRLADRVAVLRAGAIVAEGSPAQLADQGSSTIRFRLPAGIDPSHLPLAAAVVGDQAEYSTDHPLEDVHLLTSWALDQSLELDGLEVRLQSLEDVYLRLVGEDS